MSENRETYSLGSMNRKIQQQTKSNQALTPSERKLKRELKKNVKAFQRINKLSKKIRHAQSRRDSKVEQEARLELSALIKDYKCNAQLQQNEDEDKFAKLHLELPTYLEKEAASSAIDPMTNEIDSSTKSREICKKSILTIYNQVILMEKEKLKVNSVFHNSTTEIEKKEDIAITRNLLKHMTKGTQSRDMFRNSTALWGYTRQKFYIRAMLVVTSLLNLEQTSISFDEPKSVDENECNAKFFSQPSKIFSLFDIFKDVQSICSIGCGPGNDIVGFLSFLQCIQRSNLKTPTYPKFVSQVQEIILLDYAMDDWKQVLIPMLDGCKTGDDAILSSTCNIVIDECDITRPLFSTTEEVMHNLSKQVVNGKQKKEVNNVTAAKYAGLGDIFLISYLLSETRNLWDEFLLKLIETSKRGCIFYFAEPTPWQLHRLISMFELSKSANDGEVDKLDNISGSFCNEINARKSKTRMRFLWIDSSMNLPALQGLHARLGPAVLLGIKL